MDNHIQLAVKISGIWPHLNERQRRIYAAGEPLSNYETVVQLIANTTTSKGITVVCRLDRRKYKPGIKITDEAMQKLLFK